MAKPDRRNYEKADLPQGKVAYRDEGEGPPVVFSHGIFVDSSLWDGVVERLVPAGFRCIRPETPMGAHRIPLNPDADTSPPGVAELLADFIDEVVGEPVTVVGNDSGGAIAQMLAARHPQTLNGLVLTNCDALEVYPPAPFNVLTWMAKVPGGLTPLRFLSRFEPIRRATYRSLTVDPIADRQLIAWGSAGADPGIRRDITRLLTGVKKEQTFEAAEGLRAFERPVLLAWGTDDRYFKPDLARRLAEYPPNARVVSIEGGRTFVPIDRPAEVAEAIRKFVDEEVNHAGRTDAEADTLAAADAS